LDEKEDPGSDPDNSNAAVRNWLNVQFFVRSFDKYFGIGHKDIFQKLCPKLIGLKSYALFREK
jgi:hypothetical protein